MAISHLYPTQRPALDLNFARQKRLDSRVTFTRGSTATYVGSDGLIKTAASGEARFDHNSDTGESLGLLIEESRTNKLLYSGALDGGKWTSIYGIYNADTFTNAAVAPDGSSTAKEVRSSNTSSTAYHSYYGNGGVGTGNWNFSIFVKPNGITTIQLNVDAAYAIGGTVFDLTGDGSVTSGSGSFVKLSNGWWRLSTYGDISTYQRADCAVYFTSAGDGSSGFYLWGAQLEAGAFPTSYIPTTAATVTRSADVASMTGTNFSSWYNQSEGSWFVNAKCPVSSNNQWIFALNPNYTGEDILYRGSTDTLRSLARYRGDVFDTNDAPSGQFNKAVLGYSLTSQASSYFNTVSGIYSSISGDTRTPTSLAFGRLPGDSVLNGHIARLTYYPTRLSNDQLQALTL